jgi:uncharacterized membrane protein YbaN (DUF454 family)
MPADQNNIVLKLPPEVATNDANLHAIAVSLFRQAAVRSVTFDGGRTTAVVRLNRGAQPEMALDLGAASGNQAVSDSIVSELGTTESIELVRWIEPRDQSISFTRLPGRVRGWRKVLYLALAGGALSLGLLGIVLPGLPTTPFVLIGSYFLVRSSTRLHERLMASRVFGGVLRDWHVHRGVRPHVRARAVAIVALVVAASLLVARPPLPIIIAIGTLAAIGLAVIWRLPSVGETEISTRCN